MVRKVVNFCRAGVAPFSMPGSAPALAGARGAATGRPRSAGLQVL